MKRGEDGEWQRLEPRPDLAVDDDAPRPRRRRPRPSPGKVTRTLSLPAPAGVPAGPSGAPPLAATADPLPDVFGGALPVNGDAAAERGRPADVAAARAALDQAFAAHRTALVAAASSQGPLLQQAAAAEHAITLSAIGAREASARRIFADARAAIRATEREQIALATADADLTARRLREAKSVETAYRSAADAEADRVEGAGLMAATIVETSGSSLVAMLGGISGNALREANLDLRPGEGESVLERLEAVRVHHKSQIARERYELRAAGVHRARDIRNESRSVVEDLTGAMVEAADEVVALGAQLGAFFAHAATTSIEALATTEARVMAQFDEQRARAADVLRAAPLATNQVKERARAHLDTLTRRHIAVNQALDRAGRSDQGTLTAAGNKQRALLDDVAATMLAGTNGAPTSFAAEIAHRREQAMSALDTSLATLSNELQRANAAFRTELDVQRSTVIQDYAAGENTLVAAALAPLGEVVSSWKSNGDAFVGTITQAAASIAERHAADTKSLQRSVKELVNDTISDARDPKRRARESLRASGRGIARGAKGFAIGVGTFVAVNIVGGPIGGVAYLAYGAFENLRHRIETLESTWESRSTFGKFEGVIETTFVVAADQFGATPIVEGMVQREAITHRHLDAEQAAARSTEGLLAAVTAGIVERVVTPKPSTADVSPSPRRSEPGPGASSGTTRPRGCFVAGTQVWTPSGLRTIETLAPGAEVIAIDVATGEAHVCRTIDLEVHEVGTIVDLRLGDETLSCSEEHPLWIPELGWRRAGAILPADRVGTATGETTVVAAPHRPGCQTVFNLRVAGLHTYLVSRLGVLVHNKGNAHEFFDNRERLVAQLDEDLVSLREIDAGTTTTGEPGKADLAQRSDLAHRIADVKRDLTNAREFANELTIDTADALELPTKVRAESLDKIVDLRTDVAEASRPYDVRLAELTNKLRDARQRLEEATLKNDAALEAGQRARQAAGGGGPATEVADKHLGGARNRRQRLKRARERLDAVARDLPHIFEDSTSDSGIAQQKARVLLSALEIDAIGSELATGHMFGSRGPQINSKTLWKGDDGFERIDIENPNPGERPGQIHYQPAKDVKWYYDSKRKRFYDENTGKVAPPSVQEKLSDPEFSAAIDEGLRQLGEDE